jgi:opacity protein-like surface antigen
MKSRITVLLTLLALTFISADVYAQRYSSGKFRSGLKRKFKPSTTVFASPGLLVMNSENGGRPEGNIIVGVLKSNGMGPTLGVGAIYQFAPKFGVEGKLSYVNFKGIEDSNERTKNDFTFKTDGVEVTGSIVFNILDTYTGGGFYGPRRLRFFVPYVKAGVGLLAYKSSSWHEQNSKNYPDAIDYPAVTLVFPVGGGIKYQHSKQLTIAPELNVYFTTSDYLDNTSSGAISPYTGSNDAYLSATVKVMYNLAARRRSPFRFR